MTSDHHDEDLNIQNILRELTSEVATANQKADDNNETNKYILEQLRVMNGRGADHERRLSMMEGGRTVLWQSVTLLVTLAAVGVAIFAVVVR